MARAIVFCTEDAIDDLKSFYVTVAPLYNFEIVSYVPFENQKVNLVADFANKNFDAIDFVILHSYRAYFYSRLKFLEAIGVPSNRIIDGRVFQMPNLDFPRLLKEGIAYSILDKKIFSANSRVIYPQVYKTKDGKITLSLGTKSYIREKSEFDGRGLISLGNFSSFAKSIFFSLGQNETHNYRNVSSISVRNTDWVVPMNFLPPQGDCEILIGNDVWCGRGSIFKSTNPNKPLVIGDGAVIASDSVVVKDIPPYAIVGGNPAKIIKYRFPPHIIEAMLRIKWWDWDIDKIHDNFKYFNDIEKFISLHDK